MNKFLIVITITFSSLFTMAQDAPVFKRDIENNACGKEIVGYFPNWKQYRRNNVFTPKNIDFSKYTIINYAFWSPDENGNIIKSDPWGDNKILGAKVDWSITTDEDNPEYIPYQSMVDLAHREGTLVNLSLGGWTLSEYFTFVAGDPEKRSRFAGECSRVCREFGFDGVDIDWEFPGDESRGCGRPDDFVNFTLMCQEIRDSLDALGIEKGRYYMLTGVVHAIPSLAHHIDWESVTPLLDYVMYFGYDYNGAWSDSTCHQSPLYPTPCEDPATNISSSFKLLTETYNVPPSKVIVGTGFYGRTMINVDGGPELCKPHSGNVDMDIFGQDEGTPTYYNILLKIKNFDYKWDDTSKVPYLTGKSINSFVTFDDVYSLEAKAEYIRQVGAAGCLIWEIEQDFIETSNGSGTIVGTPLIDRLNEVFNRCENEN